MFNVFMTSLVILWLWTILGVNGQSDSCGNSGSYDRCWKSSNVQISEGNTFSVSMNTNCYNTRLKIGAYSLSASYPLSESLRLACRSDDDENFILYSNFLNASDSTNNCSLGLCLFSTMFLIDDDDFYEEDSSLDGFDGSLRCKIDTISGFSDSDNGWMEVYCYDSSQTDDPTPEPTDIPTDKPTTNPTNTLSVIPTTYPTPTHTDTPTDHPLVAQPPTREPSPAPSKYPSSNPTFKPSLIPTVFGQSQSPSFLPTNTPFEPTELSTLKPSFYPTRKPTSFPVLNESEVVVDLDTNDTTNNSSSDNNSDKSSIIIVVSVSISIMICLACISIIFYIQYHKQRAGMLQKYYKKNNRTVQNPTNLDPKICIDEIAMTGQHTSQSPVSVASTSDYDYGFGSSVQGADQANISPFDFDDDDNANDAPVAIDEKEGEGAPAQTGIVKSDINNPGEEGFLGYNTKHGDQEINAPNIDNNHDNQGEDGESDVSDVCTDESDSDLMYNDHDGDNTSINDDNDNNTTRTCKTRTTTGKQSRKGGKVTKRKTNKIVSKITSRQHSTPAEK